MNVTRKPVPRFQRMLNQPDKYRGFVSYKSIEPDAAPMAAQFGDISNSGMRLISRLRNPFPLQAMIVVEFELPGSGRTISLLGTVVRIINEFEFAIQFFIRDEAERASLSQAIKLYVAHANIGPIGRAFQVMRIWGDEHRRGLILSIFALLIFGAVALGIFFSSDEYLGKPLKSWGQIYPKQWFIDYVKHFN